MGIMGRGMAAARRAIRGGRGRLAAIRAARARGARRGMFPPRRGGRAAGGGNAR